MNEEKATKIIQQEPSITPSIRSPRKLLNIPLIILAVLALVAGSVIAGIKIGKGQVNTSKSVITATPTTISQDGVKSSKPNIPFPKSRNKTRTDYANWIIYKDKSGYSFYYPNGWFITEGGQQVESWNSKNTNIRPGPITGDDAKWDLYFGEKVFSSFEEVIVQADITVDSWDLIEVSSTAENWPVYFAFKESLEPMGGPYLIFIVVTPEGKTITWHGFSGDSKSPNIEKLKQIAESLRKENTNSDISKAKEALETYFNMLSEGKFSEATKYHGSGYEYLVSWNPSVLTTNYSKLLENGCTQNGLNCLKVKTVLNERTISPTEFLFVVQFANQDGSLFKRGPCCGATETTMPTKTDFEFTVKKDGEKYLVITQPVYTP